ncbi:hypothetical protein [Microcoleus sp. herbarium12]
MKAVIDSGVNRSIVWAGASLWMIRVVDRAKVNHLPIAVGPDRM